MNRLRVESSQIYRTLFPSSRIPTSTPKGGLFFRSSTAQQSHSLSWSPLPTGYSSFRWPSNRIRCSGLGFYSTSRLPTSPLLIRRSGGDGAWQCAEAEGKNSPLPAYLLLMQVATEIPLKGASPLSASSTSYGSSLVATSQVKMSTAISTPQTTGEGYSRPIPTSRLWQ